MIALGTHVIARDGFEGEVISESHGGSSPYSYGSSAAQVNLQVTSVLSTSGEIRRYLLESLTEVV